MKKQTKSSPLKMAPIPQGGSGSANVAATGIYTGGYASAAGAFVGSNSTGTTSSSATQSIRGSRGGDVEFTEVCRPLYVLEKHLSVIRKGPTSPPKIEMYSWEDSADINNDDLITIETTFTGDLMPQSANQSPPQPPNTAGTGNDGGDISIFYNPNKEIKTFGVLGNLILPIDIGALDWDDNYTLLITHRYVNNFGIQITATCRAKIIWTSTPGQITCTILSITSNFPIGATTVDDVYSVKAEQIPI